MSNPSVACVMLANGRPEMVARAVRSFLSQTYANRLLLIWDTGETPLMVKDPNNYSDFLLGLNSQYRFSPINLKNIYCHPYTNKGRSVGELRNDAISEAAAADIDIIVTMDSDDVSHPRRIEEQVALLVESEAEACGYNEVLFCHEECHCGLATSKTGYRVDVVCPMHDKPRAWLYSNPAPNYAVGASLAFWRSTWARRPFPHLPVPGNRQSAGEDAEWLKRVECVGTSALPVRTLNPENDMDCYEQRNPRLICSIHGGNSQAYELALPSPYFKRAPQFDEVCRKEMAL